MECRPGCAACCVALSISSPIPGMPDGKPAGTSCVQLDPQSLRCRIWGTPSYPRVCREFTPDPRYCGTDRESALDILARLERETAPDRPGRP